MLPFTDAVTIRRIREDPGGAVDVLGQPVAPTMTDVELPARIWATREGHRESVEAKTGALGTFRISGYAIAIPRGNDVREEDRVISMRVGGSEWLHRAGDQTIELEIRGIVRHRLSDELFCEVVR